MKRRARISFAGAFALAFHLVGTDASAQTVFEDVEDAFPDQGCQDGEPEDVGCWTNYLRLTDLDGDGDLDAIFPNNAGFFDDPGAQPLEIYLNDGDGTFEPGTIDLLGSPVEGSYRVVAVGDIDGDGRRDLFVPSASGDADLLFVQAEAGVFTEEAAERIDTRSRSAAARFGDVDGDGDLDLLVGGGYDSSDFPPAFLYSNDGTGHFTELQGAAFLDLAGTDVDDLDFVDVDGDSDLDVLVNTHRGKSGLWLNDGTGVFDDYTTRLPPLEDQTAYHYGPAVCDIDGDGDRDLIIDNVGPDYGEQVLINDGAGTFTAESDRLNDDDDGDDDNGIVCLDFDDDGDLDLIVMSLSSDGERLYENDGTGHFDRVDRAFTELVDPTLWMEAGDVNGDGRLDVVTAQGEGDPQLERLYLGTEEVAVDVSGPRIFAIEATAFFPEIRFAVQDNAFSDEGPRILGADARLADAESPIPATFMGGDLFRVLVPEDATTFDLCATDLAGNLGCAEVSLGDGSGGAGGTLGQGGYQPIVSASVGEAVSSGMGGAGTTGSTSVQGSGGGDGAADAEASGGCDCEAAGAPRGRTGLLASIALAVGAMVARRRTARNDRRSGS